MNILIYIDCEETAEIFIKNYAYVRFMRRISKGG